MDNGKIPGSETGKNHRLRANTDGGASLGQMPISAEVAVDSMREKIKHCVEQVVLSDQNMAQGTDWEHMSELCRFELPWGVERHQ